MTNFIDSNNHLNIVITTHIPMLLQRNFCDLMGQGLEKFFGDFFDVRTSLNYPFETGGYSGTIILGESHVNWHTFPEDNLMKIDIYSCKDIENKLDSLLEGLGEMLGAVKLDYNFSKGSKNYVCYKLR